MRRLRRSVLLRLWAAALLASLGLGATAPVAAATRAEGDRGPLALESVPADVTERALAAAAGAATPEAFAEAVAGALRAALGEAAPSEAIVLHAVYGQLFRVLQEEFGGSAVVVAPGPGLALHAPSAAVAPPHAAPDRHAAPAPVPEAAASPLPTPRLRCPSVQPLGP